MKSVVVVGANGAIGSALICQLSKGYPQATIHAFSRTQTNRTYPNVQPYICDYFNDVEMGRVALHIGGESPIDMVIVATGILHSVTVQPEKTLRDLNEESFQELFKVNTILPALIAKHFIPHLRTQGPSYFAALSARVGSISDNRLGGWYAYRASKAALNMIIKTLAIETKRRNKKACIVGLHPGTVDSSLSKPYQSNVKIDALFDPAFSAEKLLSVLTRCTPDDSGKCFAWDGNEIQA